jgi:hypothetical protein
MPKRVVKPKPLPRERYPMPSTYVRVNNNAADDRAISLQEAHKRYRNGELSWADGQFCLRPGSSMPAFLVHAPKRGVEHG